MPLTIISMPPQLPSNDPNQNPKFNSLTKRTEKSSMGLQFKAASGCLNKKNISNKDRWWDDGIPNAP